MEMRSWLLSNLRLETPRLTLRLPSEGELDDLAQASFGRVLSEDEQDFMGPWTQLPDGQFQRSFYQYHMSLRGSWSAQKWDLQFFIFDKESNEAIGCMGLSAEEFSLSRSVNTGSWILPEYRGRGLGKEARSAVLHLAFNELGAIEARSGASPSNHSSLGVSHSLGYHDDGEGYHLLHGRRDETIRLLCKKENFQPSCKVEVFGLDSCRDFFGGE